MTINYYLDNSKSDFRTIWCYIRENGKTVTLNTGEQISYKLWDKKRHRANVRKTKNPTQKGELNSLNNYLDAFEVRVREVIRSVRRKDFKAGFGKVADELKKQFDRKEITLFDYYDDYIKAKRIEVSKSYLSKIKRTRALLYEFDKNLTFDKFKPHFFDKFFQFLIDEKGLINNTANKSISYLKSFLIWANVNGYTENISYKSFKIKNEATEVIYLTEPELMKLYNMEINNERLERVRDLFVFQCFTGVRYSDIENISKADIHGATWSLRTKKTRQLLEIPLNSYALSVLQKYKEFPQPLPVISNQKQNKYIKELCELAGIDEAVKVVKYKGKERIEQTYKKFEVIGTHTARRTFISLSLQKGMKPDVIMSITGHSTYTMMKKYLKIADEHKRDEMDKIWGSPLKQIK